MTQQRGIICAGNWIVDLVHEIAEFPDESDLVRIGAQSRSIGGGAANVMAALARLQTGVPLWPMGAVGDDEFGRFVLAECKAMGVPTARLLVKSGVATAHTHVMSAAGKSRTFFYQGGANDALNSADFPTGTFANTPARIFYLGYLNLLARMDAVAPDGSTEAAQVLARAQAAGLITCVDLVSVHSTAFAQSVTAACPHIDYLILNEAEAARAVGDEGPEAARSDRATLSRLGRALIAKGVCKAVVIHCPEVALWCGADGAEHWAEVDPLPPEQIASHLGAGDAFCAGLIHALHEAMAPDAALALANQVARASLRGVSASEAIPPLTSLLA